MEPSRIRTLRLTILFSLISLGASPVPTLTGTAGWTYSFDSFGILLIGYPAYSCGAWEFQRSITTSSRGREQQVKRFPLAGGLSGLGS